MSQDCACADSGPESQLPPPQTVADVRAGDTCVICQQALQAGDTTRQLPCGHSDWHDSCFLQWLAEQPSCPMCRAAVGEDTTSDDASTLSGMMALSARVDDLQSQVGALHLQWQLQTLRAHVLRRIAMLESDRQNLERQINGILEELTSFGTQLVDLHDERLQEFRTHCLGLAAQLRSRHRLHETEARRQNAEFSGAELTGFQGHSAHSSFEDATDSREMCAQRSEESEESELPACSENTDVRPDSAQQAQQAEGILARLSSAVMRTPLSGRDIFRALAGRPGRMGMVQAIRVMQHLLEGTASYEVLARAFVMLDVNGSGFVEESDWMSALHLPRMCVVTR
mmetsp:Transcript_8663/g.20011  ORF Transcript_8663/g.20011 Transcript_8663/m.20011 type:complete len:341 (-) Transcript_8663:278-1300(-)